MLLKSVINANDHFSAKLDQVYLSLHEIGFFNNNNFEMRREKTNKKVSRKNNT